MPNRTDAGSFDGPILCFLSRARRRYLTRELFIAALAGAGASLALAIGLKVADLGFGLTVPGFAVGPVLFLVLGAVSLGRSRRIRVAGRADRSLRFHDRLATFLDFRGRTDVDRDFRSSQARETAAAVARADLKAAIPIPLLLWVAPLALGWMLYIHFFDFFLPAMPPFVVRVVNQQRAPIPGSTEDDLPGQKPQAAPDAVTPPDKNQAAENDPPAAKPPAKEQAGESKPPAPSATAAGGAGGPAPHPIGSSAIFEAPARLYSEPVGKALTPVVDAARSAAAERAPQPEAPLQGRISFNLIPTKGERSGPAGEEGKAGSGPAEGIEITIDYDAVPPEYRAPVRRYFETLVRLFQGGTDGT